MLVFRKLLEIRLQRPTLFQRPKIGPKFLALYTSRTVLISWHPKFWSPRQTLHNRQTTTSKHAGFMFSFHPKRICWSKTAKTQLSKLYFTQTMNERSCWGGRFPRQKTRAFTHKVQAPKALFGCKFFAARIEHCHRGCELQWDAMSFCFPPTSMELLKRFNRHSRDLQCRVVKSTIFVFSWKTQQDVFGHLSKEVFGMQCHFIRILAQGCLLLHWTAKVSVNFIFAWSSPV